MTIYPHILDEKHRAIDEAILDYDTDRLRHHIAEEVINSLVPAIRIAVAQAADRLAAGQCSPTFRYMATTLLRERLLNELATLLSMQQVYPGDEWRFDWLTEDTVRAYMSYPKVTQDESDTAD
jgi:hypothetical protein